MAGFSVITTSSRARVGILAFGFRDNSSGVKEPSFSRWMLKGRPVSWRRMCGAREQAPGE